MKPPASHEPSQRNDAEDLLGRRLASWIGPYPDEVGWILSGMMFALKVTLLITLFWCVIDSVLPSELGDRLAASLVIAGLAAIILGSTIQNAK